MQGLHRNHSLRTGVFLMGTMFSDWLIQYLEIRESNNQRRLNNSLFDLGLSIQPEIDLFISAY